jgi:hypothetical protein
MIRHLTEDEISRAIAGQSTFEEQQHANACSECRGEIAQALQVLALVRQGIRSYAEYELQRSTPTVRRASAFPRLTSTWLTAGAIVAVVAIAALAWHPRVEDARDSTSRTETRQPRQVVVGHVAASGAFEAEFYPLEYSNVPVTNGHFVRIAVPRSAPVAFGLDPINFVSAPRGAVLADVFVGEDGLARAVRFVRPGTDEARKE